MSMTTHQLNFSVFFLVSPDLMRPQARQFWGEDLIRAVSAIFYEVVHSLYRVFWVMRLVKKSIRFCTRIYSISEILRGGESAQRSLDL